jgi:hypothetical protein
MKIFLTILAIISLYNIVGCAKATNDYNQFVNYHNSGAGFVLDFLTGYNSAQQGDYLGPTLDIINQDSDLVSIKNNAHFWAWIWVGITALVYWRMAKKSKA